MSIHGVVASVTQKTVLYGPIPETGVITAATSSGVTLSTLNANSGILEENTYPASQISLHKNRLLFYLANVKLFRGVAGRMICVLIMKYIREFLICLFYYQQSQGVDILVQWPIQPSSLVRLLQYIFITYNNAAIISPMKQNHVTLVGCLFKILKNCVIREVQQSTRGKELLLALEAGTWDEQQQHSVITPSLSPIPAFPPPSPSLQPHRYHHHHSASQTSIGSTHGKDVTACTHGDSLSFADVDAAAISNVAFRVHSLHPCLPRRKYYDRIIIPGAAGLRVIFDKRCDLDQDTASLTFFHDEQLTDVIARFTGSSSFCSFTVRGNALRFLYEASYSAKPTWGYAFVVEPFKNIRWSGDGEVLNGHCFDWSEFALDLVIRICKATGISNQEYFDRVLRNLVRFVRTAGMPFKSTVISLLIRVLSVNGLKQQSIDVR